MKVYIIRHGQTEWNKKGRIQGKTDIELNKDGIEQATMARKNIENYDIDLIIASPLKRARQTAEIINKNMKVPIIYENAVVERDFGEFEGMVRKEIKDEMLNSGALYKQESSEVYKGVEPMSQLCERVWIFLDKLKEEYKGKNILIVTHGGVTRAINGYFEPTNKDKVLEKMGLSNCEIKMYEM